jgi:hypothetical protein
MDTKAIHTTALTAALLLSTLCSAQDAIQRYFGEYLDSDDFTTVVISSKMFQLFAKLDPASKDAAALNDALAGLRGIRIISAESRPDARSLFNKMQNRMGTEYEVLMGIDEKDEKVRFFIREEGDRIAELFMLVGGANRIFAMSLSGQIDLNKISSLSKNMNVGGMQYLEKVDEGKRKK